jgi:hypothetical protein
MIDETLLSTSDILNILNIPRYKLTYLFESKKLRAKDFTILGNGHRVYTYRDLDKIKKALQGQ